MEAAIPREFRPRIERINEDFGHLPLHELRLYLEPRVEAREHFFERALAQSLLTSENAAITGAEQTLSRLQRGELSLLLVARDLDFPTHLMPGAGVTGPQIRSARSAYPFAALPRCAPCSRRWFESTTPNSKS
jgi:hypothetical protein